MLGIPVLRLEQTNSVAAAETSCQLSDWGQNHPSAELCSIISKKISERLSRKIEFSIDGHSFLYLDVSTTLRSFLGQ